MSSFQPLYFYSCTNCESWDFQFWIKNFICGQIFWKIKKLILCEKFIKIEIFVEMIVQNVLFPTVVFLWLYELWELRFSILNKNLILVKYFGKLKNLFWVKNDSSERPLCNRGRFLAVRVMRVEIFNYE